MAEVDEESGKSSSLTDLTLEVRQSGGAEQEVFLQHGLSLGRNASNTLCIDHPEVERIHAQVMRQTDGTMLLECASDTTQVTLPDGKKVHQLILKPGTTFKIGPATVRCLKRQTKPSVVVTDNPWQVRCPRCHEILADLSHDAHKCPSCKTELFYFKEKLPADVPPESGFQGWLPRLIGPYQIRAFVAQGGMGIVLRGLHKENDMPAAVKLLKGDPDHDPSWKARFEAEINTLTSLKHPNVVRLQAHGRDEKLLWLAMDWIDGTPIGTWIAKVRGTQGGFLPIEQIRPAMTQIVSGLQYLHRQQIIHRDLKPSNILVAQDDSVKMVDFGIARTSSGNTAVATRLTQTGMITGTESYMAPEQAEGREVTPASDIYSLGVIWYELLTSRRPMGTFVAPEIARPDTPPTWSRAISQCLAVDPASRPSLDDLTRAINGIASPPPIPGGFASVVPGKPQFNPNAGTTRYAPPPVPPAGPPTNFGPPPTPWPAQPPGGTGGSGGAKLQKMAQMGGGLLSGAAAFVGAFLRQHPPKQWIEKLGPVANAMRKSPKVWVGCGIVGILLFIILLLHGLSDKPKTADNNPTPAPTPAANVPAQNTPNPNNPNPNPQPQQGAPAQVNPMQMAMLEEQAYQAAERRMAQNVMYAQFPPIGNPNVQITPQDSDTFNVRSLCQGFYPGRGMGTLPFTCTVHHTADGNWNADDPQY